MIDEPTVRRAAAAAWLFLPMVFAPIVLLSWLPVPATARQGLHLLLVVAGAVWARRTLWPDRQALAASPVVERAVREARRATSVAAVACLAILVGTAVVSLTVDRDRTDTVGTAGLAVVSVVVVVWIVLSLRSACSALQGQPSSVP